MLSGALENVVYYGTFDTDHPITIGQAESVMRMSNCFWASMFNHMWDLWIEDQGGEHNVHSSQAEWLCELWPEQLRKAAWDCCPKGKLEVIVLDDD